MQTLLVKRYSINFGCKTLENFMVSNIQHSLNGALSEHAIPH